MVWAGRTSYTTASLLQVKANAVKNSTALESVLTWAPSSQHQRKVLS